MCGEWKAWLTVSRLDLRSGNAAATASAASSSPATTTERGPLTAAMLTRSVSSATTSSSEACTAIMTPTAGQRLHQTAPGGDERARVLQRSTPATWAAVISPME
ncbi:hypothetical protein GCM10020254_74890 [Streptomyces goshikiensis]